MLGMSACRKKLRVLRTFAGTSWGCQKEMLEAYLEPTMNFAVTIWIQNAAASSVDTVQRVQNAALQIAMGCRSNTPIDQLHHEAKLMLAGHPIFGQLSLLHSPFVS